MQERAQPLNNAQEQTALKIEHYTLGKTLGVGAFGKVKLARHDITGVNVAIKIINKKKIKNAKMKAKIKREISLLRYFSHPNIIKLYEVLDTNTDIFAVTELVSGGELFDYVAQRGKLPESEARHFFRQLVEGVEHFHHYLVAHRDLKLENILLTEDRTLKIADFGLSNLMKDGKFLQTSCGSPHYAAPEVISGKSYCGNDVDTWSCGVILFALLAGYLPFDEEVIANLFSKIKEAKYNMPEFFSKDAQDLLRKILRANPLERIKFYEIKFHPWLREAIPLGIEMISHHVLVGQNQINERVFQKLFKLGLDFHGLSERRIREAIKKRKYYTFVTAYELLNDDFSKHNPDVKKNDEKAIFEDVLRILKKGLTSNPYYFLNDLEKRKSRVEPPLEPDHWFFGLVFPLPAKEIMVGVYETLTLLKTQIKVKSQDYKIKCYHKLKRDGTLLKGGLETIKQEVKKDVDVLSFTQTNKPEDAHLEKIENNKINRFSKEELVFYVNIFEFPSGNENLVDLQLSRGHTILFAEFSNHFIFLLNKILRENKGLMIQKRASLPNLTANINNLSTM